MDGSLREPQQGRGRHERPQRGIWHGFTIWTSAIAQLADPDIRDFASVAMCECIRLSLQWIDFPSLGGEDIMRLDKALMGGNKYRNGFGFTLGSETLRASLSKIKDTDMERAGDVYSFYVDLDASIRSIASKTKSGGYQFEVAGNRTVKNEFL